jgi:hypothetical protein
MNNLDQAPKYFRGTPSTGVQAVDREGGQYDAGMINGVSVITRGEALGHDLWVDQDFLSDVTGKINQTKGLKARFTHPGLSSDGIGTKLGVLRNAVTKGDQVFADLHFQKAAHVSPDGNLADYVMTLAEETPDQFGLSIVFEHDADLQAMHIEDNTQGGKYVSPDEDNKNNLPHAALKALRAGDVVDEPAANPDGLFKRGQEAAQAGDELLCYALGLSDAKPQSSCFGVDGDRAAQFVARFLSRHNLTIQEGGDPVSEDVAAVEIPPTREEFAAELQAYTEAFGSKNGAKWFADGVHYQEAQGLHIETLHKQIVTLQAKVTELEETLESLDRGDDDGADFDAEQTNKAPQSFAGRIRIAGRSNAQN